MVNENKPNMDSSSKIGGNKIDNRIENLSSIIKLRNSSRTDFFIFRAQKASFTYKKLLPRLQFLGILVLNAIAILRPILQNMLLLAFLVR